MKFTKSNLIVILFLLLTLISLDPWSNTIQLFSYKLILARTVLIFTFFIALLISYRNVSGVSKRWPLTIFLIWVFITIIRSVFISNSKEEWTFILLYVPAILSIISVYYLDNLNLFRKLNNYWFKYAPWGFLLLIPIVKIEAIGFFFSLCLIYLLFIQILQKKIRFKLIFITIIVMIISLDTGVRGNVLKFGLALLFGLSPHFFSKKILTSGIKFFRLIFLLAPLVFLLMAISNIFNVFKMDQYITSDYTFKSIDNEGNQIESSLIEDTRTLVYLEVLNSAVKNDYIFFGRTFARGYDSVFQARKSDRAGEIVTTNTMERVSEISILNVFTWMGITGVVLYFLLFFKATSLAIYHSNNIYIKIVGLFVAFRWMFAWVEDFQKFDISTITLWILLAICFSNNFRKLNNYQFETYIKLIFIKK